MIGLIDYDYNCSKKLTIPSLEIMKLYSYYTGEERRFCRLLAPDENEFSQYRKIYFSSNKIGCEFPDKYKKAKNIEFIGNGFTNGTYVPFSNKLIDYSLPRIDCYKNDLSQRMSDGTSSLKEVNDFLNSCYYRSYAGENKLPMPRVIKNKRVYLYDDVFFNYDWKNNVDELTRRGASTIITVNPIYCSSIKKFLDVRSCPKVSKNNQIILDCNIPFNQIHVLFNRYELNLKANIVKNSNIGLAFGSGYNLNHLYYEDLYYKLNILYSFWSKNIPIKMYYFPSRIYNPICRIEERIANWALMNTENKKNTTIFDLFGKKTSEEKEVGRVLKYNPKWQYMFEQTYNDIVERGFWRL